MIRAVGSVPEIDEVAEPSGDVVEVLAASVNPIDLAVSRGILATGHPELPYVPGCEGVGRTADGRVVWVFGGALGRTANGAMAERVAIGDSMTIAVPDGADPAVAAGLGIAGLAGWLPLAWRAPLTGGENVLVLGATGAVGLVAVQAAKLLGAARVVAAGRSAKGLERATELGADATVRLDVDDLASAFKDAFGGYRPELRLRSRLGSTPRGGGAGGDPAGDDRQPRPVGRRDRGARLRPASGSRTSRSWAIPTSPSPRTSSPSTTTASSATSPPGRSSSTSSACRSTTSLPPGSARPTAPAARSSCSCRERRPGTARVASRMTLFSARTAGRGDAVSRPIARGPTASRGCPRPSGRSPAQQRGRTRRPAPARPRPSGATRDR